MELLPAELRASLPALYSQERESDPIVHLKFFSPYSNWTWFVTEGSPEDNDFIFFGYVIGFEEEWGNFSLSELQSARHGSLPLVERDLYFKSGPFSKVIARAIFRSAGTGTPMKRSPSPYWPLPVLKNQTALAARRGLPAAANSRRNFAMVMRMSGYTLEHDAPAVAFTKRFGGLIGGPDLEIGIFRRFDPQMQIPIA